MTIERFGPTDALLDHLVYAVPDLAAAVPAFTAATGVEPAPGGRHLGRGTRNYLVGLGPTAYLEIIGPDLEHPADAGVQVPFGLDALTTPRLVTWAVHPVDITTAVAAAAAAGADLGPILPMSRRTPAGDLLEWRLTAPDLAPFDGVTPFLIDWGTPRTQRLRRTSRRCGCAACAPPTPTRPARPPSSTRSACSWRWSPGRPHSPR